MTAEQYFKNLEVPTGAADVVLDTDTFNEIDDQFALSYMMLNRQKLNVRGICAAPFLNARSSSPEDGMEKSYDEIIRLLDLLGEEKTAGSVYKGSRGYLTDEQTPVPSAAADFIASLAGRYSPEKPLYIVAIGAITNVASAILKNPKMTENCVVIWLGGHAAGFPKAASEFNMTQDIAAARVVFGCGVPLVQLPCAGVVDRFATSKPELTFWLEGKNKLCDYLLKSTVGEADSYAAGKPWTRVIWDVTAVAWLLNDGGRFMRDRLVHSPVPEYDRGYAFEPDRHLIKCVYHVDRDALFEDLFKKLAMNK